ncbi:hypothetical protein SLEP1_g23795 [Rubroshorea leprosula]|uniref:Uncharacterized protein n=1 Tax=Rubroshorea leprosula TaxID=152421 RepID=A0AAV5JPH2_9ROSI|nr:hypothetical protein SLEP1_g23795 [Rubroshorea leprosula]
MTCKKHPTDLSSSVGVCASCLTERLLSLIAAQEQVHLEDHRKSDPPQINFPRSVSPYVSRRKSDVSWPHHHYHHLLRFHSTPQVGPTYTTTTTTTDFAASTSFNKKKGRFSLISNLFRPRSEKLNLDPRVDPHRDSYEEPSSSQSSSWFSAIFSGRRKKQQSRMFYMDTEEPAAGEWRSCRVVDRGMSPVRRENTEDEDGDRSTYGSSQEASPGWRWRRTPVACRRGKAACGQGRNVSRLAFCMSPLVRASPNRHWNQKGGLPPEIAFTGEIRAPVKPCPAAAAPFCKNRSRKLADFGRVHHNR